MPSMIRDTTCPSDDSRISLRLSPLNNERKEYPPTMDKKEINSPLLTARFVLWACVGCLLLLAFLGHYMWKVF
jgi:hypothetical protein